MEKIPLQKFPFIQINKTRLPGNKNITLRKIKESKNLSLKIFLKNDNRKQMNIWKRERFQNY